MEYRRQNQICQVCECNEESCKGCTKKSECVDCSSNNSCCCTSSHAVWHNEQVRRGLSLEYFSLGWMSVEVIASVIAGMIIGKSFALLAFAGDSVVEIISAFAVLSYIRNLTKGNFIETESERTEKISHSLLILLIPVIALGATYSYFSGVKAEASPLGIAVSLGAVVIMSYLWTEKKRLGKEANIVPLAIDAIESATCLFMSVAVLGSLLLEYFFGFSWADYVATAIILVFLVVEVREYTEEKRHS
jgi:divalent metal cation (Fe/Co/Zn/Cd) transporter